MITEPEGTNDWLTRFGRSVASQAVETIENRLKAPSMRQASQRDPRRTGREFL